MYIIVALIVTSCDSKEKKMLLGAWAIESITENGNDAMFNYYSNLISFERGNCSLPKPRNNDSKDGTWSFLKKKNANYIFIYAEGNKISGEYKVVFERDSSRQLLLIHLTAKNMQITCAKALHNFKE